LVVGDVDAILRASWRRRSLRAISIVRRGLVPELAVSGYPPEDLLFHSGMRLQVGRSLDRLKQEVRGIHPDRGYSGIRRDQDFQFGDRDSRRPCSPIIAKGLFAELPGVRRKALFYARHRTHSGRPQRRKSGRAGVRGRLGCGAARQAREAGAQVLLVINASPYEVDKQTQREQEVARARVGEARIPLVFAIFVGGQDELVLTAIPS